MRYSKFSSKRIQILRMRNKLECLETSGKRGISDHVLDCVGKFADVGVIQPRDADAAISSKKHLQTK